MQQLSASNILNIWEIAISLSPSERALTMLTLACPDMTGDDLSALPIGQRDGLLLNIREKTFGSRLSGFTQCPKCCEGIELSFSTEDIRANQGPPAARENRSFELADADIRVRFRLLDSRDLVAVKQSKDSRGAAVLLADRCILEVSRGGEPIGLTDLPIAVLNRVAACIIESDPLTEVLLDLHCPACGHTWRMLFDIESFLWAEISAAAKRLLREVHVLASVYGWSEADILSMSTARRHLYLEMVS